MSAYGYKQTCGGLHNYVRFAPESGHHWRKISSVPESGRKALWRGMSAYDPKQTSPQFSTGAFSTSHSAGLGSHSATARSAWIPLT